MACLFNGLRSLWLLPATILLAGAGYRLIEHREVIGRGTHIRARGLRPPPTMYGEHLGLAVAFACLAIACMILAFRRPKPII